MMNLPERIALDVLQHMARLADFDRILTPISGPADKYWTLRNQIEKIVERRLLEAIKEERYE